MKHLTSALGFSVLSSCSPAAETYFQIESQLVWSGAETVFSLDTGDLLPDHPGVEIALLDTTGHVYLITPGIPDWTGTIIIDDSDPPLYMAARPTVTVGDLLIEVPGEEVAAMASQHLNIARRNEDGVWTYETIFSSEGMTGHPWGTRTGDYLPTLPGDEFLLIQETAFDVSIGHLGYRLDQEWFLDEIYQAQVGMDSAVGELDSSHDGPEVILPTEMWECYQLTEAGSPPYDHWPGLWPGGISQMPVGFVKSPMWSRSQVATKLLSAPDTQIPF